MCTTRRREVQITDATPVWATNGNKNVVYWETMKEEVQIERK